MVEGSGEWRSAVLERLAAAINAHDLDALVACFADDYVNETPAHPQRGFRGRDQVRANWTQIFAGVADIRARIPRSAIERDSVWTEWELSGTRVDGAPFQLCGVVIFALRGAHILSARFYLEPVETTSGDVAAHTPRVVGTLATSEEPQGPT